MRAFGGVSLWLVATIVGVVGAGWFSLAGLGWSGGFTKRYYWEDGESGYSVGFALVSLAVWVALLVWSVRVMRGGSLADSRAARVTSTVLAMVSIAIVVVMCVLFIAWPETPSEYPSPPWNRA
ncbi:MAG: hypothetical protein WBX17_06745 [Microbacterium sp.]